MAFATKAPGNNDHSGLSLLRAIKPFGASCARGALSQRQSSRQTEQYRCPTCGQDCTVKTGTLMPDGQLP